MGVQVGDEKQERVRQLVRDLGELGPDMAAESLDAYYWADNENDYVARAAGTDLLGKMFVPKPRKYILTCCECGELFTEAFASWSSHPTDYVPPEDERCRSCWAAQRAAERRQRVEELAARKERAQDAFRQEQARRPTVAELKAMPYEGYLQTDHWQEVRQAARERAGNRCQLCNDGDEQLDTHHRTYERIGEELPEDVFVICNPCHGDYHGKNGNGLSRALGEGWEIVARELRDNAWVQRGFHESKAEGFANIGRVLHDLLGFAGQDEEPDDSRARASEGL